MQTLGSNTNDIVVIVIITGAAAVPTILLPNCSLLSGPIQGHPAQTPGLGGCPSQCPLGQAKEIQEGNIPGLFLSLSCTTFGSVYCKNLHERELDNAYNIVNATHTPLDFEIFTMYPVDMFSCAYKVCMRKRTAVLFKTAIDWKQSKQLNKL